MTLKERLKDWCDPDEASGALAVCLGLMLPEDVMGRGKRVFWTNNPLGNSLFRLLEDLERQGVLEVTDNYRWRWNPEYKGEWET